MTETRPRPSKKRRKVRGAEDLRVTITAGMSPRVLESFKQLSDDMTAKNRSEKSAVSTPYVSRRQLQEEAIREQLARLAKGEPMDVRGTEPHQKRKGFWLNADLYEEMRDASNARGIPVTLFFITACTHYLMRRGFKVE